MNLRLAQISVQYAAKLSPVDETQKWGNGLQKARGGVIATDRLAFKSLRHGKFCKRQDGSSGRQRLQDPSDQWCSRF